MKSSEFSVSALVGGGLRSRGARDGQNMRRLSTVACSGRGKWSG